MQLEFERNTKEAQRLKRLILLGAKGREIKEASICPFNS